MLELPRHSSPKVFFSNTIVSLSFSSSQTQNSLQMCCLVFEFIFLQLEQHSVFHTRNFVTRVQKPHYSLCDICFALNDSENIPLSENIVVVCVSFTHVPPTSIRKYIQLADRGQSLDSNNTSCISYTIQYRELAPYSFNLFWTTLHEYVPYYTSIRWCCVTLRTQAQNLWSTLFILGEDLYALKVENMFSKVLNMHYFELIEILKIFLCMSFPPSFHIQLLVQNIF